SELFARLRAADRRQLRPPRIKGRITDETGSFRVDRFCAGTARQHGLGGLHPAESLFRGSPGKYGERRADGRGPEKRRGFHGKRRRVGSVPAGGFWAEVHRKERGREDRASTKLREGASGSGGRSDGLRRLLQ